MWGGPWGQGDRTENSACPLLLAPSEAACSLFLLFYPIHSSNSWEEVTRLWRLEVASVPGTCGGRRKTGRWRPWRSFLGQGAWSNPIVPCALSSPAMLGLLPLQFELHTSLRVHPKNRSPRKSTRRSFLPGVPSSLKPIKDPLSWLVPVVLFPPPDFWDRDDAWNSHVFWKVRL